MPIKKHNTRNNVQSTPETAKPIIYLDSMLNHISITCTLFEGIESTYLIHRQLYAIDNSLVACRALFEAYSENRIDFSSFIEQLRGQLTSGVFEKIKRLGFTDLDRDNEIENLIGPLSLLDEDPESCRFYSSQREPGVVDSILADEEEGTECLVYPAPLWVQRDFKLIVYRLIALIRSDGLLLQACLNGTTFD
ncbi:MAG: hypothetical protein WCL27_08085 [Betaproteobacteria bacterium]